MAKDLWMVEMGMEAMVTASAKWREDKGRGRRDGEEKSRRNLKCATRDQADLLDLLLPGVFSSFFNKRIPLGNHSLTVSNTNLSRS